MFCNYDGQQTLRPDQKQRHSLKCHTTQRRAKRLQPNCRRQTVQTSNLNIAQQSGIFAQDSEPHFYHRHSTQYSSFPLLDLSAPLAPPRDLEAAPNAGIEAGNAGNNGKIRGPAVFDNIRDGISIRRCR